MGTYGESADRQLAGDQVNPDDLKAKEAADALERRKLEPPYPWCHGSPTKEDCIRRGYCNRDPNCGE